METNSTPIDKVEWVKTKVIKVEDTPQPDGTWLYEIILPSWLASWDVFAVWEKERFASMQDHLKKGDVLFDIGAENGWQSMIYAQMVDPENMVLIEPSSLFWANIKHTWDKNFSVPPKACYLGLISDKTDRPVQILPASYFPILSTIDELIHFMSYSYIHEHSATVNQITIDDYSAETGIVPTALTIDIEGAELLALKGAEKTLRENDLKVWVSVHPDLAEKNYGIQPHELNEYMVSLGYVGEYLATDHEQHWYYHK